MPSDLYYDLLDDEPEEPKKEGSMPGNDFIDMIYNSYSPIDDGEAKAALEPLSPDTKLADGSVSTLIYLPEWTPSAIVCWGGLRIGGKVTVHLPGQLVEYGAGYGSVAQCMPQWGVNVIWTFQFGYTEWDGAYLCKNCFDSKTKTPKAKRKPKDGWLTYGVKPHIETWNKYEAAVEALLKGKLPKAVVEKILSEGTTDPSVKRIVDI